MAFVKAASGGLYVLGLVVYYVTDTHFLHCTVLLGE